MSNMFDPWISVKERLPEENTLVLTYVNGIYGRYMDIITWDNNCSWCRKVTHWMPLPEPPKEG